MDSPETPMTEEGLALIDNKDQERIDVEEASEVPLHTLADNMEEILVAMGWDLSNPSITDTPMRFLKYLKEFHVPFDAAEVLKSVFDSEDVAMVIQDQIPFRMICEHHLLPAVGVCAIGYIPDGKVLGLSKFSRLVDAIGVNKPSLQEHINHRIAEVLQKTLEPKGVIVVLEAEHGCMACRGVYKPGVITRSTVHRGVFSSDPATRAEFFSLAKTGFIRG